MSSLTGECARLSFEVKQLEEIHGGCSTDINKSSNIDGPYLSKSPLEENSDQDVVTSKKKNIQAPRSKTYKDLSDNNKLLVEFYYVYVTAHGRTSDNALLKSLQEKTGLPRSMIVSQVCQLRYRMMKKLNWDRDYFWGEMKAAGKKQLGASEVLVTEELKLISKNTSLSMKKLADNQLEKIFKNFRDGNLSVD